MPGWSYLGPLLGQRRARIVVLAVASVVTGITEAGILGLLSEVAAGLVNRTSSVHLNLGPVNTEVSIGAMLAIASVLAFIRLGLQGVVAIIPARIGADLQVRLRGEMFSAFTWASWSEQSRDREGHMQEIVTNQIITATGGALLATVLLISAMSFLVLVLSALVLNALAAVVVLVAAGLLFVLMRPLSKLGNRFGREASLASLAYASGVGEGVRLAQETQVFGVGAAQRRRVEGLVEDVRLPVLRTQFLMRLVPGVYQSLIYILIVAALAVLYATGAHHIAALGAVVLILVRAGSYGQQVQGAYQGVRQSLPFLESVEQVRRRYADSTPAFGDRGLSQVTSMSFHDVSYAYEQGRPVLTDITFSVSANETIGVVGPTGAGKSTIVQILLGLREPSEGEYRVNGHSALEFKRADWTNLISYLPQEPRLMHASVRDNIRFFRDIHEAAVTRAAELAGIHSEVMTWRDGYDTIVGPRADAVSGGQQQRICLARALAAQPKVLVLDEPTSALDPRTELLIQQSLTALKHELTLFIVAHRMSTLDICERVMVIVDGRLQAFDTVGALMQGNIYYRAAVASHLGTITAPDASAAEPRAT